MAKPSSPIAPFLQMRNRGPTLDGAVAKLKVDRLSLCPDLCPAAQGSPTRGRGESSPLNLANMFARGKSREERIQFQPTCKAHG